MTHVFLKMAWRGARGATRIAHAAFLLVLLQFAASVHAGAAPPARKQAVAPPLANAQIYPSPEEAPAEIAMALSVASQDHKRVLLVFGGNWCYDCHVLDATFHSKQIAPLIEQNFHVVHVNVGEFDRNTDLAKKYEIPLKKGVPSLAVLDPDGALVVSQKEGEFENTSRIGPQDVIRFLERWKPQKPK